MICLQQNVINMTFNKAWSVSQRISRNKYTFKSKLIYQLAIPMYFFERFNEPFQTWY